MKGFHLVMLATAFSIAHPVLAAEAASLSTLVVRGEAGGRSETSLDGVVEAVRQTLLSSQVAGAVVAVNVKAGDRVKAGQELLRIDAHAAEEGVVASASQLDAARAQAQVASRELDRQKFLFQKQYISQAAMDRAQAQADAAEAQVRALQAQNKAARAQSGFFVIRAPYAGVVGDVPVVLGDMAMPGRPLISMYDPSALRVSTAVPQALMAGVAARLDAVRYELSGSTPQKPARAELLPVVDPATHTAPLRLSLPAGQTNLVPGMFARVWLPLPSDPRSAERILIPAGAVFHRGEMTGVYVVNAQGKVLLRQVRTGRTSGEQIEVLSGLRAGEKVATDPQVAATAIH